MATLDDARDFRPDGPGPPLAGPAPPLFDGQRLDQATFHELYCRTPEDFRSELIDGVVHVMSSPVNPRHARPHITMGWFLKSYEIETPGTIVLGDATAKLGPRSEVQPDCALLIEPACGGRTGNDPKGYTTGCPELVVEIASGTLQVDLNAKKAVYEQAGAPEYVVFDEPHRRFHWFTLVDGRLAPIPAEADGVYRSRAFPGLWLDAAAFLRDDGRAVMATLRLGLASPGHADFVDRLARNRELRP